MKLFLIMKVSSSEIELQLFHNSCLLYITQLRISNIVLDRWWRISNFEHDHSFMCLKRKCWIYFGFQRPSHSSWFYDGRLLVTTLLYMYMGSLQDRQLGYAYCNLGVRTWRVVDCLGKTWANFRLVLSTSHSTKAVNIAFYQFHPISNALSTVLGFHI